MKYNTSEISNIVVFLSECLYFVFHYLSSADLGSGIEVPLDNNKKGCPDRGENDSNKKSSKKRRRKK